MTWQTGWIAILCQQQFLLQPQQQTAQFPHTSQKLFLQQDKQMLSDLLTAGLPDMRRLKDFEDMRILRLSGKRIKCQMKTDWHAHELMYQIQTSSGQEACV